MAHWVGTATQLNVTFLTWLSSSDDNVITWDIERDRLKLIVSG